MAKGINPLLEPIASSPGIVCLLSKGWVYGWIFEWAMHVKWLLQLTKKKQKYESLCPVWVNGKIVYLYWILMPFGIQKVLDHHDIVYF